MKQSNQQKSVAIKPKVFFPIYTPLHFEKVSYEELHNSLKEIEAMSGSIKFNIWGAKSDPAEIRLILPEDSKDFFPIEESNLRLTLPYFVLSFSQQVTLSDFFVECSDPEAKELPLQERIAMHVQGACEGLALEIRYFLFLSHIAKPGHIRAGEGKLFYDETNSKNIEGVSCDLQFALEVAEKISWPEIHELLIQDVWLWATSFKCGAEGFGFSPAGRALAAFSHLFNNSFSNSATAISLFWSMVGLESLYTSGSGELTQQLLEKPPILLGEQKDYKKHVKSMYNYRSRFVHGDIPFPNYFYGADASPEYEDFFSESSESVEIATAILLATLQQLVRNGWHSLNFEYSLKRPETVKP